MMKKFLHNIFAMFVFACMTTSCTNEMAIDDGNDNNPNHNTGKGDLVSLSLKIPYSNMGLRNSALDSTTIG